MSRLVPPNLRLNNSLIAYQIEFIIDTKPGERVEAPQRQGPYSKVTGSGTAGEESTTAGGMYSTSRYTFFF